MSSKQTQSNTDKHQKRLHFIVFVDSAKTRSFSIKISHAWIAAFFIFLFTAAGVTSGFLVYQSQEKIENLKNYVIDVKRGLFAQSISSQKILTSDFISHGYNDENSASIVAIANELAQTDAELKLSKAQSQKKNIKLAAKNTADLRKTEAKAESHAKTQTATEPPPITKQPAQKAKSTETKIVPTSLPVQFENVELQNDTEEPGTLNISFDLQNLSGKLLTGWVCAAVSFQDSENKEIVRAAPDSVSLNTTSAQPRISTCKGGELVKFSRLRPTILSTSGSRDRVKKLSFYFTDSSTGKQYVLNPNENR